MARAVAKSLIFLLPNELRGFRTSLLWVIWTRFLRGKAVFRTASKIVCFWVALISLAPLCDAAVIQVSTQRGAGMGPINVGQGVTVNVFAQVNQPASPGDGIFTFDQDLIVANLLSGQPAVLQVQSVTRPGTSDTLLGGSNGTATASGIHAIYGGYLDTSKGLDAPTLLFSVNLLAQSPGTATVTPGPAVDPYGFDFVLYQSLTPTVLYGPGLSLTVTSDGTSTVPLPPGAVAGIVMGCWVVVNRFAQRHRRSV